MLTQNGFCIALKNKEVEGTSDVALLEAQAGEVETKVVKLLGESRRTLEARRPLMIKVLSAPSLNVNLVNFEVLHSSLPQTSQKTPSSKLPRPPSSSNLSSSF